MVQLFTAHTPLTPEQKQMLIELEFNADPTTRLNSNYYTWSLQELMEDYHKEVSRIKPTDDALLIRRSLTEDFLRNLATLRQDYENDLNLMIELTLATASIWTPFKMQLPPHLQTNTAA